ncbi:MAG: protein BatD [Flavobacteriaceae bacterium]|nr:protein BatD [Flavobacteriaceae bacterium]
MISLRGIIFFLGVTFTSVLFGQDISFTATVNKSKVGLGQNIELKYKINKQGTGDFKTPNFKGFRVLQGPFKGVSQTYNNGAYAYNLTYTYILQSNKIGDFVLGKASLMYKDKKVNSNSIKISVVDASSLPKNPNDPNFIADQNIHLKTEFSNNSPYVGQSLYAEIKLLISDKLSIHNYNLLSKAQYNGFWNQEIEIRELKTESIVYNGESYLSVTIQKALLIPQKSGKLVIEPIEVQLMVGIPTGRADFWGNMMTKKVNRTFTTKRRFLNVKELPLAGKPFDFNGAVGDFKLKVKSSKSELKSNESAQLVVSVSGTGNIKLFELPKIELPLEIEIYTPEHKENIRTTTIGLKGNVEDHYTIVPQYKGEYIIPEVSFSYFNPIKKKYYTLKSKEIPVSVKEGKNSPSITESGTYKQGVKISGDDFRFIQTKTVFNKTDDIDFYGSGLYYLLLILGFIMFPITLVLGKILNKNKSNIDFNKQKINSKLAKKYFSESKKALGKKELFYIALEKALHNYLKSKLRVETTDISKDNIIDLLKSKNIHEIIIKDFIKVLNDCDFARYSPTTDAMMKEEYKKAIEVISKLDKQL